MSQKQLRGRIVGGVSEEEIDLGSREKSTELEGQEEKDREMEVVGEQSEVPCGQDIPDTDTPDSGSNSLFEFS